MQAGSLIASAYTALARPGTMGRQLPLFTTCRQSMPRRAVTVVQTTSRKGRPHRVAGKCGFSLRSAICTNIPVRAACRSVLLFLLIMCLASTVPQSHRCGAVPPECRYLAGNAGCTVRTQCSGRPGVPSAHCGRSLQDRCGGQGGSSRLARRRDIAFVEALVVV